MTPTRGRSIGSNVSERIVSQVLTELDGLDNLKDVVVITATNRVDMVDPALMRPGRIDRILYIPNPDLEARKMIFNIHLNNKPISDTLDMEKLASLTDGYSGADIASICSAASIVAINEHLSKYPDEEEANSEKDEIEITDKHFKKAFDKVKSSSYQKATIYWDQQKNTPNNNIIA